MSRLQIASRFLQLWIIASACCNVSWAQRNVEAPNDVKQVQVLSQNWTDDIAERFYHEPQGSTLIPRAWLLALEQPDSELLFLDPSHIISLGYIPQRKESHHNPDGLPLGFSYEGRFVGLTCAACHTALIRHRDTAWIIDGAPSGASLDLLLKKLALAMEQTASDDDKFERFAKRVLVDQKTGQDQLRLDLRLSWLERRGYNERNLAGQPNLAFGPGRVDAFGAILNEVSARFLHAPENTRPANAPVSFPFIWDAPHHDRVQWNGIAENEKKPLLEPLLGTKHVGALGRNIGEVLGVFGSIDPISEGTVSQFKGYPSSANKQSLIWAEETLSNLWSPTWPSELATPDPQLVKAGELLYKRNCIDCHSIIDRKDENRQVTAKLVDVKTDPQHFKNFGLGASTKFLEGRMIDFNPLKRFGATSPRGLILKHLVQRAMFYRDEKNASLFAVAIDPMEFMQNNAPDLSMAIEATIQLDGDQKVKGHFYSLDFGIVDKDQVVELITAKGEKLKADIKTLEQVVAPNLHELLRKSNPSKSAGAAYKARPLNGIWATAPYLHNGSVLTLDEILKPAKKRKPSFNLGSGQFDAVNVGFMDDGPFEFDTRVTGNSNSGHDHETNYADGKSVYEGEFSDDDRKALLAFLSTL